MLSPIHYIPESTREHDRKTIMKSICLIAKGPSAIHANEFMDENDDVAVINDASVFTKRDRVDYCFVTHNYYTTLKDTVHKIRNIVTVAKNAKEKAPRGGFELLDEIVNVNKMVYEHLVQGQPIKPKKDGFIKHIASGVVCWHHTSTGALHWLAKYGKYDLVKVIGIDGGDGYAPGGYVNRPSYDKLGIKKVKDEGGILDRWKGVVLELVKVLENIYDCKFEFYHSSKN
jgi:hypothetical protein